MTENKMTFLEQLQAHKGGLIQLKTQLYWYVGGRGYDNTPGRICLILDATTAAAAPKPSAALVATPKPAAALVAAPKPAPLLSAVLGTATATAFLLVDGSPHWVWVAEQDVEVIYETR